MTQNINLGREPEPRIVRQPGETVRVTLTCGDSLTKQEFKDECDLNIMMDKWARTGGIPDELLNRPSVYGNFPTQNSYQEHANRVAEAKSDFEYLPSSTREFFANDVGNLIDFLSDETNLEEAVELGLVQKPEEINVPTPPTEPAPEPNPPAEPPADQ